MVAFAALPSVEEGQDSQKKFKGVPRILGPKWAHMPTINIGMFGVQIFWCIEMSYASPYLLSLGLSKSKMAIVFLAPPMSGLVVQPLIGILADSSTSSFGRRRPFILGGTIICVVAMLLLGYTRSFASIFTGWNNSANDILTIWLAVLAIYAADFSINAVQTSDRALLVDTLPYSEQATGNAWAARVSGVGAVMGFFVGNIDLPHIMPFFGDSQLKVLSVVLSLVLLIAHILMCALVKERILLKNSNGKSNRKTFYSEMKDIWVNLLALPHVIRQICLIQLFAWIAWFPILFYSTLYIGELHKRASPAATTPLDQALLDAEATRLGTRALFYSSVISLGLSLLLPAFVPEAAGAAHPRSPRPASSWKRCLVVPPSLQVHLSTMWAVSLIMITVCMFATFLVDSVSGAMFIIAATGFPGALCGWAPNTLLAQAILTEPDTTHSSSGLVNSSTRLADIQHTAQLGADTEREALLPDDVSDELEDTDDGQMEERRPVLAASGVPLGQLRIREMDDVDDLQTMPITNPGRGVIDRTGRDTGTLSAKAGIILGIHNTFIVIPQLIVTGLSAVLFALVDGNDSSPSNHAASKEAQQSNSVVYILRIGGVSAAVAFVICWRLSRELRHRY